MYNGKSRLAIWSAWQALRRSDAGGQGRNAEEHPTYSTAGNNDDHDDSDE